jgi:hypothetical protein
MGTGPRQPAHHSTDTNIQYRRSLRVRQLLDTDEQQHGTLILGKGLQCIIDSPERKPCHRRVLTVAVIGRPHAHSIGMIQANTSCPLRVDPRIPHDAEHPALRMDQTRCVVPRCDGAHNGILHQVIGLMPTAGKRPGKPAKPRQKQYHASPHLLVCRASHGG